MGIQKQDELHLIYQTTFGGIKIFIDKVNQNVVVKKRILLFPRRQRVIPFSAVMGVVIDYEPPSGGGPYGRSSPASWKVSLHMGNESIKIEQTTNQWGMWSLAYEIAKLIGKEIIDRDRGGTTRIDPKLPREEIVARWRKRAEQEAEERKKQWHWN